MYTNKSLLLSKLVLSCVVEVIAVCRWEKQSKWWLLRMLTRSWNSKMAGAGWERACSKGQNSSLSWFVWLVPSSGWTCSHCLWSHGTGMEGFWFLSEERKSFCENWCEIEVCFRVRRDVQNRLPDIFIKYVCHPFLPLKGYIACVSLNSPPLFKVLLFVLTHQFPNSCL